MLLALICFFKSFFLNMICTYVTCSMGGIKNKQNLLFITEKQKHYKTNISRSYDEED